METVEIKNKADLDIFSCAGDIPILNIRDVVDVLNHLQVYLHKAGIITDVSEYRESLERFIESKGQLTGNLSVIEYNLEENEDIKA